MPIIHRRLIFPLPYKRSQDVGTYHDQILRLPEEGMWKMISSSMTTPRPPLGSLAIRPNFERRFKTLQPMNLVRMTTMSLYIRLGYHNAQTRETLDHRSRAMKSWRLSTPYIALLSTNSCSKPGKNRSELALMAVSPHVSLYADNDSDYDE